jgi:hypothetical protein
LIFKTVADPDPVGEAGVSPPGLEGSGISFVRAMMLAVARIVIANGGNA